MSTRLPKAPQIHVKVTQDLITSAIPRDSHHCMIAEAIQRDYPALAKVSADLATIRGTDPKRGLRFTWMTPRVAQVFLVDFDRGRTVDPFEFKLRGAQVTSAYSRKKHAKHKPLTPKQREARMRSAKKMNESLRKARLRPSRGNGSVPDRVGGKTPPMQLTKDGVPFSRRRAFGLRALEY